MGARTAVRPRAEPFLQSALHGASVGAGVAMAKVDDTGAMRTDAIVLA